MLTGFFMICAVGGGAFILAQVLLSILALGSGHGMHLHHGAHAGHAAHAARGAGARAGARSGALRGGAAQRGGGGRALAHGAGKGGARSAARSTSHATAAQETPVHWASSWLHGLFTFQGLTAGAAVLGLSGLAATAAKWTALPALGVAVAAAFVMMAAIAGLLELMASMEYDTTVRIEDAVGQVATVYLGIPPRNQGLGKISVTLRQQSMEFSAATAQETALATGQKVIVVAVKPAAVMEVVSAEGYLRDIAS